MYSQAHEPIRSHGSKQHLLGSCMKPSNFWAEKRMIDHQPCTTTSSLKFVENLLLRGSISPGAKKPLEQDRERERQRVWVITDHNDGGAFTVYCTLHMFTIEVWSVWLHCLLKTSCSSALSPHLQHKICIIPDLWCCLLCPRATWLPQPEDSPRCRATVPTCEAAAPWPLCPLSEGCCTPPPPARGKACCHSYVAAWHTGTVVLMQRTLLV